MTTQSSFGRDALFHIEHKILTYMIAFVAMLFLLLAAAPSAQAQGGCRAYERGKYHKLPSDGYVKGTQPLYKNSNCTGQIGTINFGRHGTVFGVGKSGAIQKCISETGNSNMTVTPVMSTGWACRPRSGSGGDGSGSSSGGSSSGGTFPGGSSSGSAVFQRAEVHVSKLQMGSIMVNAELGMSSGIQFSRFDQYAVGVQSVADRGILDVVDVWGQATQYFEVCFPQTGAIFFLDASTSPRSVVDVDSFVRDGHTCAAMNRAGTMVLVKDSSPAKSSDTAKNYNDALAQAFIKATTDPVTSAIALDNCTVSSPHHLNLRQEPWGPRITVVPKHTTVQAIARTESWYKVRFTKAAVEGDEAEAGAEAFEGWMSAWLSEGAGDCDWQSDDEASPALASSETAADAELSVASLSHNLRL